MIQAFQSHMVPQFKARRGRFGFQSGNPEEWSILLSFDIPVGTCWQNYFEQRIGIPDRDGDNGNRMQIAPEITFEGTEPSPAAREAILKEIERLEITNHPSRTSRVSVIAPSHAIATAPDSRSGSALPIPPLHENIVVNHSRDDDARHEHVEVAIRDAANARRQIDALAI